MKSTLIFSILVLYQASLAIGATQLSDSDLEPGPTSVNFMQSIPLVKQGGSYLLNMTLVNGSLQIADATSNQTFLIAPSFLVDQTTISSSFLSDSDFVSDFQIPSECSDFESPFITNNVLLGSCLVDSQILIAHLSDIQPGSWMTSVSGLSGFLSLQGQINVGEIYGPAFCGQTLPYTFSIYLNDDEGEIIFGTEMAKTQSREPLMQLAGSITTDILFSAYVGLSLGTAEPIYGDLDISFETSVGPTLFPTPIYNNITEYFCNEMCSSCNENTLTCNTSIPIEEWPSLSIAVNDDTLNITSDMYLNASNANSVVFKFGDSFNQSLMILGSEVMKKYYTVFHYDGTSSDYSGYILGEVAVSPLIASLYLSQPVQSSSNVQSTSSTDSSEVTSLPNDLVDTPNNVTNISFNISSWGNFSSDASDLDSSDFNGSNLTNQTLFLKNFSEVVNSSIASLSAAQEFAQQLQHTTTIVQEGSQAMKTFVDTVMAMNGVQALSPSPSYNLSPSLSNNLTILTPNSVNEINSRLQSIKLLSPVSDDDSESDTGDALAQAGVEDVVEPVIDALTDFVDLGPVGPIVGSFLSALFGGDDKKLSEQISDVSQQVNQVAQMVQQLGQEVADVGQNVVTVNQNVITVNQNVNAVNQNVLGVNQNVIAVSQELSNATTQIETMISEVSQQVSSAFNLTSQQISETFNQVSLLQGQVQSYFETLLQATQDDTCFSTFSTYEQVIIGGMQNLNFMIANNDTDLGIMSQGFFMDGCESCQDALEGLLNAFNPDSAILGCNIIELISQGDTPYHQNWQAQIAAKGGYVLSLINMGLTVVSAYETVKNNDLNAYEIIQEIYNASYVQAVQSLATAINGCYSNYSAAALDNLNNYVQVNPDASLSDVTALLAQLYPWKAWVVIPGSANTSIQNSYTNITLSLPDSTASFYIASFDFESGFGIINDQSEWAVMAQLLSCQEYAYGYPNSPGYEQFCGQMALFSPGNTTDFQIGTNLIEAQGGVYNVTQFTEGYKLEDGVVASIIYYFPDGDASDSDSQTLAMPVLTWPSA